MRDFRFALLSATFFLVSCSGENLVLPSEGEPAAITVVQGDGQGGRVGSALADSVVVRVTDTRSRPVTGAKVAFVLGDGASGGRVQPDTAATNADGLAGSKWTLGPTAGSQKLDAKVVGAVNPLTASFSANAGAGTAASLEKVKGDGQMAPAGAPLPDSLVVLAKDAAGNPVPGVTVTWTVQGGGSVSSTSTVTDAGGKAGVQRTLGSSAGAQSTSARASGVSQAVTFSHTATAGVAARLAIVSGDKQTAAPGSQLPNPLVVRIVDQQGNGVPDKNVAWVVGQGGGSANPVSSKTDGSGTASSQWTLGSSSGTNTLNAVVSDVGFVTFTATAKSTQPSPPPPPPPAQPSPSRSTVSAAPTSFQAGSGSSTITVTVRDGNDNPLSGVSVTLAVSGSGNTVTQPGTTNSSGVATGSFSSTTSGAKTVSATAGGVAITQTATVTVTAPPPPPPPPPTPSRISQVSGDGQEGAPRATLAAPLVVRVTNGDGSPAAGVNVAWKVTDGGGSLSAGSTPSGADGTAQVTWTLGKSGKQRAQAAVLGLSGSPVTFSAQLTDVEASATRSTVGAAPSTITVGSGVSTITVQVVNSGGTPLAGAAVVLAASGAGAVLSRPGPTDAGGVTTGTLSATQTGDKVVSATANGVLLAQTATVSVTPAPATAIALNAGDGQTATAGTAVAVNPSVRVTDAGGHGVGGVAVTFAIASGGGAITGATPQTDGTGIATVGSWTLGSPGPNSLSASAAGLSGSPVIFHATATPPPADAAMSIATVPDGVAGQPTNITVQARDRGGQNLTTGGASVIVAVTGTNTAGPIGATDHGDGTYAAAYTPALTGTDQVAISLNGQPIQGSPYTSNVAAPASASRIDLGPATATRVEH